MAGLFGDTFLEIRCLGRRTSLLGKNGKRMCVFMGGGRVGTHLNDDGFVSAMFCVC